MKWLALFLLLCACDPCKACPATCSVRPVHVAGYWLWITTDYKTGAGFPVWQPDYDTTERYCPAVDIVTGGGR